jgi:hypothetical protein
VDAAADDDAAFGDGSERLRHQLPNRCEDNGGVEFLRWRRGRIARPNGTKRSGKPLRRRITRPGEGKNRAA